MCKEESEGALRLPCALFEYGEEHRNNHFQGNKTPQHVSLLVVKFCQLEMWILLSLLLFELRRTSVEQSKFGDNQDLLPGLGSS
jgi:hypothetical protein